MGDLAGWPYWKVISITGQSGAGADYQIKLEIGDSAGGDFNLEGHCTNFPQDIRITDNDGTTLLDHWVEDITANPIVVYVEVKDDLGSNRDVRVYYGKSGESSVSNGANTFLQYHGEATSDFLDSLVISGSFVYEGKIKTTSASHYVDWGLANTADVGDDACCIKSYSNTNLRYLSAKNEGSSTSVSESPSLTNGQYYKAKMILTGSLTGFIDGNQIGSSFSNNLPDEPIGLYMKACSGTSAQEYSFVRKYTSPEPTFSSAGAEQTSLAGVIMNQFQRANIGADLYNGVFT